jgi:hypothetical protein
MSLRRKFVMLAAAALVALVAGCKVSSINYFPPHPASVRVLNLMTDGSSVDVQVGGSPAFSGVAVETLTGYQSYDNQSTSFTVSLAGSASPLISFSVPLAGEQPYTLLVFGTALSPSASLVAEVAKAPTNGNIQLSVFNAAINSASVDVYVTAPGANITTLNPNYGNVSFNGASLNLAFPPGTYQIQVTQQGTKNVIYDSGGTVLQQNIALSMVLYSRGSGVLVNAAVLQSQGPGTFVNSIFARIKAINGGNDAIGPVNQLLGTLAVNLNVGFGSASVYYQGPAGNTTVNYEASSTPGATIASTPATLMNAGDFSTFIVGQPGAQQAYVLRDTNVAPLGGNVRLRFINALPGSNPVTVSVNSTVQANALPFPNASAYVQVQAAANVPITFTDSVTGATLLSITPSLNTVIPPFTTAPQTLSFYFAGSTAAPGAIITQDN